MTQQTTTPNVLASALSQWRASGPPMPLVPTARLARITELRELVHAIEKQLDELGTGDLDTEKPRQTWELIFGLRENLRNFQREVNIHRMDAIVDAFASAHRTENDDWIGDNIEFLHYSVLEDGGA